MLVKSLLIRIREGEELKAPRYASAAATRNGNLPYSRQLVYKDIKLLVYKADTYRG